MTAGRCAIATIIVATATWLVVFGLRFQDQESMAANGLVPVLLGINVVRPYEPAPLVELRVGLTGTDFDRALHAELAKRLADERKQQAEWRLGESYCAVTGCRIPFMESLAKAEHRGQAYRIYVAAIQEANANAYRRIPKWLIILAVPLAIILSSGCGLLAMAAGVWKAPLAQLSTVRCFGVAAFLSAGWIAMYAYAVPVQLPVRIDKIEMLGRYPSYFEIPIYENVALPFETGFLDLNPGLDWTEFRQIVSTDIGKLVEWRHATQEPPLQSTDRAALIRALYVRYVELNQAFSQRRREEWVSWLAPLLAGPATLLMLLCAIATARRSAGG